MEQQRIERLDLSKLTEEHKKAAEEICIILEEYGNSDLVPLIKEKFHLIPRERFSLEDSKFLKLMQKHGVFFASQGYIVEQNVEYPLLMITDDIRKFEKIAEDLGSDEI